MRTINGVLTALRLPIFTFLFFATFSTAEETPVKSDSGFTKDVSDSVAVQPKHQVRVFYFYFEPRCYACEMIETLTEAAVIKHFSEAVKNGTLTYQAVDIGTKENSHYDKKYRLLTKSVIISDVIDGNEKRWKNCDKIWYLYDDEDKFIAYITNEIKKYIK